MNRLFVYVKSLAKTADQIVLISSQIGCKWSEVNAPDYEVRYRIAKASGLWRIIGCRKRSYQVTDKAKRQEYAFRFAPTLIKNKAWEGRSFEKFIWIVNGVDLRVEETSLGKERKLRMEVKKAVEEDAASRTHSKSTVDQSADFQSPANAESEVRPEDRDLSDSSDAGDQQI